MGFTAPLIENNVANEFIIFSDIENNSIGEHEMRTAIFDPPMRKQRTSEILYWISQLGGKSIKVVDLGCGSGFLLSQLSMLHSVSLAIGVDKDADELAVARQILRTDSAELRKRKTAYNVVLYSGDICKYDQRLSCADVVVCTEVIEHIYLHHLPDLLKVIFEYIKPTMVIITTPNVELNAALGLSAGETRHKDHKFEWTRKQFNDWCSGVVHDYPFYELSCVGVGSLSDENTALYGFCTQVAIFKRTNFECSWKTLPRQIGSRPSVELDAPYEEFFRTEFWNRSSNCLKAAVDSAFLAILDELISDTNKKSDKNKIQTCFWIKFERFLQSDILKSLEVSKRTLCIIMYDLGFNVDLRNGTVFVSLTATES